MVRAWALVAAASVAACSAVRIEVDVCSDSLNDLGIKAIDLPSVVVAGEQVTLSVTQEPNKYVNKGRVHVELDVEGVKVASETYELCSTTQCHLEPHKVSESLLKFHVPKDIPGGFKTTLKVIVNDHNGALLSCVNAEGVPVQGSPSNSNGLRVSAGSLSLGVSELEFLFERWAHEYGMSFDAGELAERKRVFADNLQQVAEHNARGASTYELHLNQFAALSQHEFARTHFGFAGGANQPTVNKSFYSLDLMELGGSLHDDLPSEIDWTTKGAVTPVKNQGSCGSCWAFSTTGALEGAYFIKTGKLVSFSEQELVSCDKVDQGYNGGLMDNADQFIKSEGGLCTEEAYPYVSGAGGRAECKKDNCAKVEGSTVTSVVDVAHQEPALEAAVAKGPVSVAIEADQIAFQFYKKGVLTGACGANLDHGVLVVGYGTLDGVKYWKVKNSWGNSYGLNGYVLIQRGKAARGGECGVLLSASYPVL